MSQYKCLLCNTKFDNQKSHHTKHLSSNKHIVKKELEREKLLNDGFDTKTIEKKLEEWETYIGSTQICYIGKTKISIEQYETNLSKFRTKTITDIQDRELVYCHGPKVKSYFRLKEDSVMTDWHREWQFHFPNHVEKTFIGDNGKRRRTDVDLDDGLVIEFQHSRISRKDVDGRMNDYKIDHNKEIIWVIHGDGDVEISKVNYIIDSNPIEDLILTFKNSWKYESFFSYKSIYIDIEGEIYKISPKDVKSNMLSVADHLAKKDFVASLKENNLDKKNNNQITKQATVFVSQMGAGNGKTYSIIQLIDDINFSQYDTFIYLTKQHSAKDVIFKELKTQKEDGLFSNIVFDEESFNLAVTTSSKQYVVEFTRDDKLKTLIIGTIDSFIYSISVKKSKGIDQFRSWVEEITDNNETKCLDSGSFTYAKNTRYMNKKTLIIADEIQDLQPCYSKCLLYLVENKYISFYAVGDKLQSIAFEENAFTILNDVGKICREISMDHARFIIRNPVNKCRRFTHPELIDRVNSIVKFEKFNLPKIETLDISKESSEEGKRFIHFTGRTIFDGNKEIIKSKVDKEVEDIMGYYRNEVELHNREPKDFLIVTPVMKENNIIESLNLAIRQFWYTKTSNDKYQKFSFVHKSEEGSSIDLTDSDELTRIVTIHSSKGDGRKVVFVIGLNESTLKIFSEKYNAGQTDGKLIYESLLHVALTRMKEKIYIRLDNETDDIAKRIKCAHKIPLELKVSDYFSLNKMLCGSDYDFYNDNVIKPSENSDIYEKLDSRATSDHSIIDMKHHNIRYGMMIVMSMLKIDHYEFKTRKSAAKGHPRQMCAILFKLKNCKIVKCDSHEEYYSMLRLLEKDKQDNQKILSIPIYLLKDEGDYARYYKFIYDKLIEAKQYIETYMETHDLGKPFTHENSIFLYYMDRIINEGEYSPFPIAELYDVVNILLDGGTQKDVYIKHHYEIIPIINKCWSNITKNNPDVRYLRDHKIFLNSQNNNLSVGYKFNLVGYDDKQVYIFIIKPHINSVNNNETTIENIYGTFAVKNIKTDNACTSSKKIDDDYVKFANKSVVNYVITLDTIEPYKFSWVYDDVDFLVQKKEYILKIICKNTKNHFTNYVNTIWAFYDYNKNYRKMSVDQFINIYKKEKKDSKYTHPGFIEYFFNEIQYNKKYTRQEEFKARLIEIIETTVDNFFYQEIDD